ncbi:thymidylate kinase, partial [Pasteurella multocida subsp. multocida str. Anand1_buffalo]
TTKFGFFHRTRQRYQELVRHNPKAVTIDASQTMSKVAEDVESAIETWLTTR